MKRKSLWILAAVGSLIIAAALVVFKRPHWAPYHWNTPYTEAHVGGEQIKADALSRLNRIRESLRVRYRIDSGFRAKEHNKKVGGASRSEHINGQAFDVRVPRSHRASFYEAATEAGFKGYGWGNSTVHIDTGKQRWWTYDDKGKHVGGDAKCQYLHKAPDNFKKEDFVKEDCDLSP